MYTIRIVNPTRKRRKQSKMGRNKKGQFTKGGTRRRRRRRANPEPNPSPRRRRRRRSANPSGRRRRRRRNPSGGGSIFRMGYEWRDLIPYLGSQLVGAFVVRKWGDAWGASMLTGQGLPTSGFRGQAWTLKNYILAAATGYVGALALQKFHSAHAAQVWWRASIEQMATRLAWTEVFGRWGWAQNQFGQLPENCRPGDVHDDGMGNRWVCAQNGQWVSMQGLNGYYGEIVQAGPLGYGEIVQAGPLGYGEIVQAGPLGDGFGHLMDPSTPADRNYQAQQLGLGAKDPYAAMMAP